MTEKAYTEMPDEKNEARGAQSVVAPESSRTASQLPASHTKGPWRASTVRDSDGRRHIEGTDGVSVAIICATASSPASGPSYFEKDANAQLIAAAPDLLAAARDAYIALPNTKANEPINAALCAAFKKAGVHV